MAAALGLWLGAVAQAAVLDRVAAVVNDEVIALSEVYDLGGAFIEQRCGAVPAGDACRREAELEVLDSLILRALIRQELAQLDLTVTGQEIDRTIDRVVADYGLADRDALRQEIERSGLPWETYREQLAEQLRQMKFTENVIRPRIAVSQDEILDLYKRTVRDVAPVARVRLEALVVPVPTDPDAREARLQATREVVASLNAGELPWEEAAGRIEGATLQALGDQAVRISDLTPELQAAVEGVEQGQVTDPVVLRDRLLVARVVERAEASDVRGFEEAAPELRNRLYEQKIDQEIEEWYQQARRRAAVRILLEQA